MIPGGDDRVIGESDGREKLGEAYVSAHTVSVHIDRPAQEVFDFITDPCTWPRWHPATVSVPGAASRPALEGETIVEEVRFGPGRDTFRWEVVEREAPRRWTIRGISDRRRQKVKITYTLTPEGNGTLWEREMRFYLPRWLRIPDKVVLARLLKRNSATAVHRLKRLMEST